MAWLTGWNYRKPVTISNSGSLLTDYQVSVTVDTASLVTVGKLLSSCNDIRFTSSDGSTLLNYWMEYGPNTTSTKIWVKIPSIATGSNTIYLYYNNPSATSASNGASTFYGADVGFDSSYGWTKVDPHSRILIDTANSRITFTNLERTVTAYVYSAISPALNPLVLEFAYKYTGGASGTPQIFVSDGIYNNLFSSTNAVGMRIDNPAGNGIYFIRRINNAETDVLFSILTSTTINQTWYFRLKVISGTSLTCEAWLDNPLRTGSPNYSTSVATAPTVPLTYVYAISGQMDTYVATSSGLVDSVVVRKYASPEPTTCIGEEQPTIQWLTGWNRRKLLTTLGSTSGYLADYQMKLIVHKSTGTDTTTDIYVGTNVKDDFSDLRFTLSDGSTLLNYWTESITGISPNLVATVWIKIPLIQTNPCSTNIYTYYDNPSAASVSNGPNTFDFFEDFSGDLSKWTQVKNPSTSTITIVNGELQIWDDPSGTAWVDTYVISAALPTPTNGYFLQGKMKTSALSGGGWSMSLEGAPNIVYVRGDHTPQYILYYAGLSATISQSITANVYDTVQVYYDGITQYAKVVEKPTISRSGPSTYKPTVVKLASFAATGSYIATFDDIRVRKYVSPEPTFSAIGTEQTPSSITATNITVAQSETPCRVGICTISVSITWTNNGGSTGSFTPSITTSSGVVTPTYSSGQLNPGASLTYTFTVSGMTSGTCTICPNPN